ncbi:MAG: S9 family peptidase [Bryobacteraceae bacterium]|nr:S9 family peptidase [Bryobacteraceae bacterium]
MEFQRIGEPALAPNGSAVAFTVQSVDIEKNSKPKQIFTVAVLGGIPRRITWAGDNNFRPRWSPDSRRIAFISDRGGSSQIWIMDADGANPSQVTNLATEADGVLFSPDGRNLLFTSEVYPDCPNESCNKQRLEAEKASPVKARIYDSLLYRHWDQWTTKRRKHLFVVPATGGTPIDLTPGYNNVPPFSLGGPDDYAISPDGKEVCYVMKPDPNPAVSTNSELYVISIDGGEPVRLTQTEGAENSPLYSPDGNYLAYRSQARGGYESDRWRLTVIRRQPVETPGVTSPPASPPLLQQSAPPPVEWRWDAETPTSLTESLDRPVTSFAWSPDSSRLFFTTEDRGRSAIQVISVGGGPIRVAVAGESTLGDQQFSPDGRTMVYTDQSGSRPTEIFAASSSGGAPSQLTRLNQSALDRYHVSAFEEFRVEGAGQASVQSFLVHPPGFDERKKYPVLFLIHGGPQGAWEQSWSYRWNPQVFAGAGYVVVMPNPRGSTGFGQRFTDEINADWGGKAFDDIMAVVDHVSRLPYVDSTRMAAAGASYGGYMINWMLGHTQRFKAMVSHAGVFDLPSEAMETEELWFPKWEFQGMPWENPEMYRRWSPSQYVKDFFTPTLVTHGEQDFRVPYGQGLQLFTALQMQEVPSKLLLFPDEGHWIGKPRNSILWYETVIGWIDRWVKGPVVSQTGPRLPESNRPDE